MDKPFRHVRPKRPALKGNESRQEIKPHGIPNIICPTFIKVILTLNDTIEILASAFWGYKKVSG